MGTARQRCRHDRWRTNRLQERTVTTMTANRLEERRDQALATLEGFEVLMRDGHFDYGNGFHGRVYLHPHQLFRQPSTIWRLAQDLLDVLPAEVIERTEIVAGPSIG